MLKSYELLAFMPAEMAQQIVEQMFEADKPVYRAALAAVAQARHLRPVFLERQPRAQRHQTMLATLTKPALETAAGGLIRGWLLKKQNAMLCDFLTSLGLDHKEGVVDNLPEQVADEKLNAAVESLLAKYPRETVAVYLHAFNAINETDWPNLNKLLETDSRLQF